MEIGDYVRTKYGISKIISNPNTNKFNIDIFKKDGITLRCIKQKDVIKSSPNIIDLIEVGDYVNGLYVHGITEYGLEVYMFGDAKEILKENEIKSIVTKEMFSSVEYRVEND